MIKNGEFKKNNLLLFLNSPFLYMVFSFLKLFFKTLPEKFCVKDHDNVGGFVFESPFRKRKNCLRKYG